VPAFFLLSPGCTAHAAAGTQVIDDTKHITLVGLGSVSDDVKKALDSEKRSATKNKARHEALHTCQCHLSLGCSSCERARSHSAARARRTWLRSRASRRADASAALAWAHARALARRTRLPWLAA
jgi:Na+-translocating ferredoxin:NAD+ oxidoreductase RNF subunit RnfB